MFNRNHKMFITTFISILFLTGLVFADPTDGCDLEDNNLFITTEGDVLYKAIDEIGGFQFNLDGATASAAGGGDAAAAGFVVQGSTKILGFLLRPLN